MDRREFLKQTAAGVVLLGSFPATLAATPLFCHEIRG
ncbi:MAG: twin-arginine translocation signal domain-containing protein [Planctomycetes bacterium]|nr:twin-arginine translocation signal domain-containing protein [Planctomycetota bacterium]